MCQRCWAGSVSRPGCQGGGMSGPADCPVHISSRILLLCSAYRQISSGVYPPFQRWYCFPCTSLRVLSKSVGLLPESGTFYRSCNCWLYFAGVAVLSCLVCCNFLGNIWWDIHLQALWDTNIYHSGKLFPIIPPSSGRVNECQEFPPGGVKVLPEDITLVSFQYMVVR